MHPVQKREKETKRSPITTPKKLGSQVYDPEELGKSRRLLFLANIKAFATCGTPVVPRSKEEEFDRSYFDGGRDLVVRSIHPEEKMDMSLLSHRREKTNKLSEKVCDWRHSTFGEKDSISDKKKKKN